MYSFFLVLKPISLTLCYKRAVAVFICYIVYLTCDIFSKELLKKHYHVYANLDCVFQSYDCMPVACEK